MFYNRGYFNPTYEEDAEYVTHVQNRRVAKETISKLHMKKNGSGKRRRMAVIKSKKINRGK